jgi:hypothetical protein
VSVRVGILLASAAVSGCGFEVHGTTSDSALPDDMVSPLDMIDVPIPQGRVTAGLVGLWTFSDSNGSQFAMDTSGRQPSVPVELLSGGTIFAPSFSNGRLVATTIARVYSQEGSRLATDCTAGGGATLEAWAVPQFSAEGSPGEPAFVVGLAANVASRNIAILHAGNRWRALVRTSTATDGAPALDSISAPSPATLAHVVVVADGTQRKLYVDGQLESMSAASALQGWDPTYPMAMFDEYQHARQWTGGLALVALYDHALSQADVMRNYLAGAESN